MTTQWWAARGRKKSGPHASRDEAIAAFRTAFPSRFPSYDKRGDFMVGYGNGGPWFDIRWEKGKLEEKAT